MKITVISLEHNDRDTKQDRIKNAVRKIKCSSGADLYMLPELWNVGFFSMDKYNELAEDMNGETVRAMSEVAREMNAYIFMGSFVEIRDSKLYNTAVLFDRAGKVCGKYSKIHLFGEEKTHLTAGDDVCVCDTEFGKLGMSICYDLRFPELYRKMVDMGAEIFLNCSAWPKIREEHWNILNHARTVENQVLWISCCASGENEDIEYASKSYVIEPDGKVILKTENEIETIETDTEKIKKCRVAFPVLGDRRM